MSRPVVLALDEDSSESDDALNDFLLRFRFIWPQANTHFVLAITQNHSILFFPL